MVNIVTVTKDNLEQEHICCAIAKNDDLQVRAKKSWLAERFEDGLVFMKGDVRGKCFIEYIPAVLYYSHQCPFTAKYVPLIEGIAHSRNTPFKSIRFETTEQAQNAPAPFTTYSLFYNGEFITNEILSDKKFEKMLINLL
jgi:hypothetical protein